MSRKWSKLLIAIFNDERFLMAPKLSIIVPIYNTEKYLKRCIDSILGQSYYDFELILVDDGSTDSSWKICEFYQKKDVRIRLFRKENGGASSARNYGIDMAQGVFLGFVDSDDWLDMEMYRVLMEGIEEYDADISVCNFYMYDRKGEKRMFSNQKSNIVYSHDEAMKEIATNNNLTYSPCNKIYNKRLFDTHRFKEGIIYEDMDLMYKLVDICEKVIYTSEALYCYYYNQASVMRSFFSLDQLVGYEILKQKYQYYRTKYPQWSCDVYAELVVVGFDMYSHVRVYHPTKFKKYDYLIKHEEISKLEIIKKCDYNIVEKLRLFLFLYFPKLSSLWRMRNIKIERGDVN